MTTLTFRVELSKSILSGISCPVSPVVSIDVDPASLSQADRETLADRVDEKGQALSRPTKPSSLYDAIHCRRPLWSQTVLAAAPAVDHLLAAIRAEDTAWDNERQQVLAAADAEVAQYVARSIDDLVQRDHSRFGQSIDGERTWRAQSYLGPYHGSAVPDGPAKERYAVADAEARRRNAAMLAAREARILSERAAELDWIVRHGSANLRRMLDESMDYAALYASERAEFDAQQLVSRLATERPGWRYYDGAELPAPKRPGVRSWALLDAARETAPDARLAIMDRRTVCVAEFGGRTIIWPRD